MFMREREDRYLSRVGRFSTHRNVMWNNLASRRNARSIKIYQLYDASHNEHRVNESYTS